MGKELIICIVTTLNICRQNKAYITRIEATWLSLLAYCSDTSVQKLLIEHYGTNNALLLVMLVLKLCHNGIRIRQNLSIEWEPMTFMTRSQPKNVPACTPGMNFMPFGFNEHISSMILHVLSGNCKQT